MRCNTIPPHCGIKTKLHSKFSGYTHEHNVRIAQEPVSWLRPLGDGGRKVFVNNFSAAGGNSAFLHRDAPSPAPLESLDTYKGVDTRDSTLRRVVCQVDQVFAEQARLLLSFLEATDNSAEHQHQHVTMSVLSYPIRQRQDTFTTTIEQCSRSTIPGFGSKLLNLLNTSQIDALQRNRAEPRLIFAFAGQGSQYAGWGKGLYQHISSFGRDKQVGPNGSEMGFRRSRWRANSPIVLQVLPRA
jgi:hypothetical protein